MACHRQLVGLLTLASIVIATQVAGMGGEDQPDLSGTWILNLDKRDMPFPMGVRGGSRAGGYRLHGPSRGLISRMTVSLEEGVFKVVQERGEQGESQELLLKPGAGPQEMSSFRGKGTAEAW